MEAREKALYTIVKLRKLADHPNTPKPEAEAARAKIKLLEEKHSVVANETPRQSTPPPFRPVDDYLRDLARQQARAREAAASRKRQRDREEAQRAYERSMADKDDRGQPKADPWSDPRTHAQRQADLNASFGKNDDWYRQNFTSAPGWNSQTWTPGQRTWTTSAPPPKPRCAPALPFFTMGGEPQMRNKATATCAKCGNTLNINEGAHTPDGVVCCDRVPGPRNKKSAQSD